MPSIRRGESQTTLSAIGMASAAELTYGPKPFPSLIVLVGPIFTREAATLPRRGRLFVARTLYVAVLFALMVTAWLMLTGNQEVRNVGDWARFGSNLFAIIAPLQLAIVILLSAMVAAAAVAQEKDRRTLILLLLTRLTNSELVLGRLLASLLTVLTMVLAAVPLFFIAAMLGGVSYDQIIRVTIITLASAITSGSLGSTLALWREKTFQTLAMTTLVLVVWLVGWELIAVMAGSRELFGFAVDSIATACSPWRAIVAACQPIFGDVDLWIWLRRPDGMFVVVAIGITCILNGLAIGLVRVWNPSRQARPTAAGEEDASDVAASAARLDASAATRTRRVWDNPILWREMRTWAYGRKIVAIRVAYVAVFAATALAVWQIAADEQLVYTQQLIPPAAWPVLPLLIVSILLVNALAVTSITTERDSKAIDLLLVTDISAAEFIFGKLGGIFYNAKEMIVLPLALIVGMWSIGLVPSMELGYLLIGLVVMISFSAMLGVHAGLTYHNSRSAIGTSLGTLMFLFLGVATCMRIMVAFRGSFGIQFMAFSAFLFGGGIGLFVALGIRNPSNAIKLATFPAPFFTFLAIVSFMLGHYGAAFLVTSLMYGWTTAAMLVPAVSDFDVATGRTSETGY